MMNQPGSIVGCNFSQALAHLGWATMPFISWIKPLEWPNCLSNLLTLTVPGCRPFLIYTDGNLVINLREISRKRMLTFCNVSNTWLHFLLFYISHGWSASVCDFSLFLSWKSQSFFNEHLRFPMHFLKSRDHLRHWYNNYVTCSWIPMPRKAFFVCYYKSRQCLITNHDSFFYYKSRQGRITNHDSFFITNYDKFIANHDRYYKSRRLLQFTTEQGVRWWNWKSGPDKHHCPAVASRQE